MAVGRLLIVCAVFVFAGAGIHHEVQAEDKEAKAVATKRQRQEARSAIRDGPLRDLHRAKSNRTFEEYEVSGEAPRKGRRGKGTISMILEKLNKTKPRTLTLSPDDTMLSDNGERVVIVNEASVGNSTPTLSDKIGILRVQPPKYEVSSDVSEAQMKGVFCNFERSPWKNGTVGDMCSWEWNRTVSSYGNGFSVLSAYGLADLNKTRNFMLKGPDMDADGSEDGHFLYLPVDPTMQTMAIKSPPFPGFWEFCKFEVMFQQSRMQNASIRIIAESSYSNLSWILQEITGNNLEQWAPLRFTIGKVNQDVHVVIEIVRPALIDLTLPLPHIAVDNIHMVDCFPEPPVFGGECQPGQLKCRILSQESCIKLQQVCDLVRDCDGGVDEMQNCDKMPYGSYCNFEDGDCGFYDVPGNILKWSRHNGPTPTDKTGPNYDHTCGAPDARLPLPVPLSPAGKNFTQCVGWYFFVNMNVTGPNQERADFASTAIMRSAVFNPPPRVHGNVTSQYYNSCMIRFYYQQNGRNYGSLSVYVVQITSRGNMSTSLWFSTKDKGEHWYRAAIFLPNVTTRYFFEIRTRMGMRIYSDSAVDDFSLAPECFGLNVDPGELGDYNYYEPVYDDAATAPHLDFADKIHYRFTPCGATGRVGPNQTMCDAAYNGTALMVGVLSEPLFAGVQTWEVPAEGYYTIIATGGSGGFGSSWSGVTQAARARALFELHRGEVLHVLVGQQGLNACKKDPFILYRNGTDISDYALSSQYNSPCAKKITNTTSTGQYYSKTHEIKNTIIQDGGGGGGGATYVFVIDKEGRPTPLAVAAGGGGLSVGAFHDDGSQRGRGAGAGAPTSGYMYGAPGQTSGAGGGWSPRPGPDTPGFELVRGGALLEGAAGGAACSGGAHGGFGGGGGACIKGGGGGGWIGGNTNQGEHGSGGFSYIDPHRSVREFNKFTLAHHMGDGELLIIPAIPECGCDYRCVALNEYMSEVQCYCPTVWQTDEHDPTKCIMENDWSKVQWTLIVVLSVVVFLCALGLLCGCLYLYNTYQRKKEDDIRRKHILEQEVQLHRLRNPPGGENVLNAFNEHYGFEGLLPQGVDVRGLPQVSRDSLKLVKALGQGAFGEVYQGLYTHRSSNAQEMPVAVKTLPELSTGQAESDFLMEAAIMAKFNHPNVVHLIGVCFDRHPRFIVLELLAGGDLKHFLRENRPLPTRSTSLTMKDLLLCALDVAKGCRYLESKRFIHRDIAARNCLLTSRGPGRVVKIADFGMARDIYRADYYKKGGKALLPIEWMPPEAFVDIAARNCLLTSRGPGRVVKIADFGMARDIYRADYYKKGGKALLPIKWMPPEAFMDGVFTIKTDCWSFGVLLWEVFSMGVMPYTGCSNREVMDMVVGGGRLPRPNGCPEEVFKLMNDTWNPNVEERPTFVQMHDRLALFLQDPEICSAPIPVTRSLMSTAEEHNSRNANAGQMACDYLVPLAPARSDAEPHTDCVASSSSTDPLLPHSRSPPAAGQSPPHEVSPYQHQQKASLEYGNIPTGGRQRGDAEDGTTSLAGRASARSTKFQPSKSTDRLLAADGESGEDTRVWETSFSRTDATARENGPPVDKLISIDTPQQTPTSTQPPDTSLTRADRKRSLGAPIASPDPPRLDARPRDPHRVEVARRPDAKKKPLCLDAARLEENLNALRENSGSVNLTKLNMILPPYINVTPSKLPETRPIQIDPKKAVIHDLPSPPKEEKRPEGKLKASSSAVSLLNGPLTELPYADSDNASSSSGGNAGNYISLQAKRKLNYTEGKVASDRGKVMKQGSNGCEFIGNDSEISC